MAAPSTTITSREQLREIYPAPSRPAMAKQIDTLDAHCRALIAHSPFVVIATAAADGTCDSSPRGGPAGFVRVLDDNQLGIPDLAGNNRLDSLENLLERPGVGLLFFVPGLDETLRVNGTARLTTQAEILDCCTVHGLRPRVVVAVTVEAAYIQCAKALRRSGMWQPEDWPDTSDLPTIACMLRDHCATPELDLAATQSRLEESYRLTLWLAGGDVPAVTPD